MDEPAQFLVEQELFSGTLGELAHALRTHALAPAQIDLFQLVRAYLTYFEAYAATDLDLATEALPRLAQVIELKVRLLLPRPPRETAEDEEALVEEALAAVALLEELEEAIHFLKRRREERRLLLPARTTRPSYPRAERPVNSTPGDLARLAGRYRLGGYFELAIERQAFAAYVHDVEQDFVIWQHKEFVDRPALAQGDGPVVRYRRWAEQFYRPADLGRPTEGRSSPAEWT